MINTKNISRALAVTFILGLAQTAMASNDIDPALKDKVTAQLTSQGYEVRKIAMEDGMIEVYGVKDGKTLEVYLDKDLKIVKTISAD